MAKVYALAENYNDIRSMQIDSNWNNEAFCKGRDTNIFLDPSREAEARTYCNQCVVKDQCLSYALKKGNMISGFYGGFSDHDRNRAYRLNLKLVRESVGV